MGDILLHDYWRSSASYRVRIGLCLLGLPHDRLPVDLVSGEQRGQANLGVNPLGLVPTLEIDGQVLTQSLAILEYLEETRRPGWLPQDPAARAKVRALAYAVAMDIHPICNLRVARHAVSLGATMEGWMQHFISLGLEGVEGLLAQGGEAGRFCWGDRVSLADICLAPQVYNAQRWGVELDRFPRLTAISTSLESLPAFQTAHPDRAKPAGTGP